MKTIFFLALSLTFITTTFGQTNPDFSGSWTINSERTKSTINVLTKSINQSETEIEILNDPDVAELITQKKPQGTVYKLSGEEVLKEIETSGGKIPVSHSAKFIAGNLEITRKQINAQDQTVSSTMTEIWSLIDEGKTLYIKSTFSVSDSNRKNTSEFFFNKNPPAYDYNLKPLNAGKVINGKARQLITPAYPKEAREAKAQGDVLVKVLIDEKGNVFFAKAVYGHPMLLQTSEQAAMLCKFSPTKINNVPVKVSGVIAYNFKKM